jgi:hypothetical protein
MYRQDNSFLNNKDWSISLQIYVYVGSQVVDIFLLNIEGGKGN